MTLMVNSDSGKELIIITGMSGAGKSVAVRAFEDLGYYCIDNLPPALLSTFIKLMKDSNKELSHTVAVMDLRGGDFFASLIDALDDLRKDSEVEPQIIFLDADNETLVRRFKETRRSHPLASDSSPLEGIQKEREMLSEVKGRANQIYNTSIMKPKELRNTLLERYSGEKKNSFSINVMSFGFKHGTPIDADLIFDVRFLPNPYYIEELRPKTGLDEEVSSFVLKQEDAQTLINKLTDLFEFMVPRYKEEGKTQLVIGFGCTGGQHRSVTMAEYYGLALSNLAPIVVTHRDISRKES